MEHICADMGEKLVYHVYSSCLLKDGKKLAHTNAGEGRMSLGQALTRNWRYTPAANGPL